MMVWRLVRRPPGPEFQEAIRIGLLGVCSSCSAVDVSREG